MKVIEIEDVIPLSDGADHLAGASIEVPPTGAEREVWWIPISGWVLGREEPVTTVEVVHQHVELRSVPVAIERHDVAWSFPDNPQGSVAGFSLRVGGLSLPETFVLRLEAGFANGHRVPFALIRGRRASLPSAARDHLRPIAVTGLARCGSTLAMAMLAAHPEVVVGGGFPYASGPGAYWVHLLRVLSEPADTGASAHPDSYQHNTRWVGSHPLNDAPLTDTPEVQAWLGRDYVAQLADFCTGSADALYRRIAADHGRAAVRCWAERFEPGPLPRLLSESAGDARELLLVRDFRDMACSIVDFQRARSQLADGADEDDEAAERFVVSLAPAVARLVAYARERGDGLHVVRYEDLATEPRATLAGILEHLALDAGEALVDRLVEAATAERPELAAHRTSDDVQASIGRHLRELSGNAADAAEAAFAPALDFFGYERSAWAAQTSS